jgi:hypothetical protein
MLYTSAAHLSKHLPIVNPQKMIILIFYPFCATTTMSVFFKFKKIHSYFPTFKTWKVPGIIPRLACGFFGSAGSNSAVGKNNIPVF